MEPILTKAAVTELTSVTAPQLLFEEWLRAWFDGGTHAVGTNDAVFFPRCNRAFNQSAPAAPIYDFKADKSEITFAEIRLVVLPRAEVAEHNDNVLYAGKQVTDYVLLQFWVSVKHPGQGKSEYWASYIGQLLKAVLANPDARYGLARKGVAHLQPSPPLPLSSAEYAKVLVSCAAQIQYPQGFGGTVVTPPDADEQPVGYYNEEPLSVGNNLIGSFQWSVNTLLTTARVVAWPPQNTSVVLELVVGGVLTGHQVTIEPGVPNQDVTVDATLNVTVPPNTAATWRVVSAPIPEFSAWHLSLTMQARPA